MAEAAGHSTISTRRRGKSEGAFRTISEVALDLDLPQHVLRFWESKFIQIRPLKRGGGRRYYRPEDVALLRRIRQLLYEDGYTIRGVQKLLKQNGSRAVDEDDGEGLDLTPAEPAVMAAPAAAPAAAAEPATPAGDGDALAGRRAEIRAAIEELEALRERLRGVLK